MLKKILIVVVSLVVVIGLVGLLATQFSWLAFLPTNRPLRESLFVESTRFPVLNNQTQDIPTGDAVDQLGDLESPPVEVLATGLDVPWDVVFLPDGRFLIPERTGMLLIIDGSSRKELPISGVNSTGEGGLLGVTLHPNFEENNWIYMYLTSSERGSNINRVERYQLQNDLLSNRTVIIDQIGGAVYHDGGRIAFGPDGNLYITTGDAGDANSAQARTNLEGKILRVTESGEIPSNNPFDNEIYSYGHRNPQGLAWDEQGRLWSTEHGPSGTQSGFDELNLIQAGNNYGWPTVRGEESRPGLTPPIIQSGADDTWAPASLAYRNGSLFFGGLRGEALYEYQLESQELKTHFKGEFGRIRTVVVGPDNALYLTTSNQDGRGRVREGDDRLIRINVIPSL